jgi:hypothetical protein
LSDDQKPPIVIHGSCDTVSREAHLHVGYLGNCGDARWCFPDEEMREDEGFEVSEALLKPLEGVKSDREIYLLQSPRRDRFPQSTEPSSGRRKR